MEPRSTSRRAERRNPHSESGRAEDVGDGEALLGERRGRDRLAAPAGTDLPIPLARRPPMDEDGLRIEIDQPDLGNAVLGVEGELPLAVVDEGGVRDLDEEEDVPGVGRA